MGSVSLIDVPEFRRLHRCVKNGRFDIVYVDLDETREGLTPDYESTFIPKVFFALANMYRRA